MRKLGSNLPMIQLMTDYETYDPIDVIATYAHGIGPKWTLIFDKENLERPSKLVQQAHENGLYVHGYTYQEDLLNFKKDPISELELWMK